LPLANREEVGFSAQRLAYVDEQPTIGKIQDQLRQAPLSPFGDALSEYYLLKVATGSIGRLPGGPLRSLRALDAKN
jgi:hypothetical protein